MSTMDVQTWLAKLPNRVKKLKCKRGPTSRALRRVGADVDFPGELAGDERPVEELIEEIQGVLELEGFNGDEEVWGLDALDEKGKKVTSWQDEDSDIFAPLATAGGKRGHGRGAADMHSELFAELMRAFVRINAQAMRALTEERIYAAMQREAAEEAAHEAAGLQAANDLLLNELERVKEHGEETVEARGVGALERAVERMGQAPNKDTLKKAFKSGKYDDLLDDPEVAALILERMQKKKGDPPKS